MLGKSNKKQGRFNFSLEFLVFDLFVQVADLKGSQVTVEREKERR